MHTRQERRGIRKARRAGLHYVHSLDDGWSRRRCGRGFAYFSFRGKRLAGKHTLKRIQALAIPPAWVAAVIEQCEEINGQFLFCYRDDAGDYHSVSSSDVNGYLREVADEPLSAKDFRTWSGSVIALKHLKAVLEKSDRRSPTRLITQAIHKTAEEMGYTKAVCRQSYIHPGLLAAFETRTLSVLLQECGDSIPTMHAELTRDEEQLLAILPALAS